MVVMTLVAGTQTSSHACAILNLYDGFNAVAIRDGSPLDYDPMGNWVSFGGKVNHYWYMNATTGNVGPNMVVANKDYKPVNANSRAGVVPPGFNIPFSENGLGGEISSGLFNLILLVGGTSRGAATFNYWLYDDNTPSGLTNLPGSTLESSESMASAPFFLSLEAPFSNPAGGDVTTSLYQEPQVRELQVQGHAPEPLTLILYGLGFGGAALYRRLRKSR